ncbi:MAG: hypothetical protein N2C14_05225, partial [Planctomycetales bacterium]
TPHGLFTFGESVLPYFLVEAPEKSESLVGVGRGEVRIDRPMIITPDASPEIRNFLESREDEVAVGHLLARTANFRHLRLSNQSGAVDYVSDSVEETIDRIARRLDSEEDETTGIISAPSGLGGTAVLRYALEQVIESAPGNVQELRERGFLP